MAKNNKHRCSICGKTGHRKETCTKKNPKAAIIKKPSKADAATLYTAVPRAPSLRMRDVQQITYPDLLQFTEAKAKSYLKELGVFPGLSERVCYHCGSSFTVLTENKTQGFECSNR